MKHLSFLMAVFIFSAAAAAAESPPKTVIQDQAEAERLLGKHLFADPKISYVGNTGIFTNFGLATVTRKNGIYFIEASLECYSQQPLSYFEPKGGRVRLEGQITAIKENRFSLKGTITFFYLPSSSGKSRGRLCEKAGEFSFSRSHTSPEDIDKDFWTLVIPEDHIDDSEQQLIGTDCGKYIEPLYIFTDTVNHPPKLSSCVPNLSNFSQLDDSKNYFKR